MIWLVIALLVFIAQIFTVLAAEFRKPSKAVAWLFILYIFPVFGFIMYLFLGREYKYGMKESSAGVRPGRMFKGEQNEESAVPQDKLFAFLASLPGAPITDRNRCRILTDGEETYAAILQAIEGAEHHIHLEYYTMRDDRIGTLFQQALIRKARDGVRVRVICDGLGSYRLRKRFIRNLQQEGVEIHLFLPLWRSLLNKRLNYRNHRKIAVVDGKIGFLGGINIGDEYLGGDARLGFWRDTHLELAGESVHALQRTFLLDWKRVAGKAPDDPAYYPETAACGSARVQIVTDGPDTKTRTIADVYFAAFASAMRKIYITTPYLVPDPAMTAALKTAARSGVDVKLIIPGVSDTQLVHWATLSFAEELLEAGVRLYQYQKGFIHAKTTIVDRTLAVVGTANMDMRSFIHNFEINAVLFDPPQIEQLERDFARDLQDSIEMSLERFRSLPRADKMRCACARLLSSLL